MNINNVVLTGAPLNFKGMMMTSRVMKPENCELFYFLKYIGPYLK